MNLTEFLGAYQPAYKAEPVSSRPDSDCRGLALHYLITLGYDGRGLSTFYSCGLNHTKRQRVYKYSEICWEDSPIPPPVNSVLECLQSDCQTGDNTYREFCNEYGYNPELSEGYVTWTKCRNLRDNLIDLFGRSAFNSFMQIDFSE